MTTTDKSPADALTESAQFLTDVVTAASLLSCGRTDKKLATRIAEQAYELRKRMHLLTASLVEQHEAAPAGIEPPRHIIDTAMDVAREQYGHGVTRTSIVAIWKGLGKPWIAAHEVAPIDMLLFCPKCGVQHIDAPEEDWKRDANGRMMIGAGYETTWSNPPHRSHLCSACGTIWRPADLPTNGVAAIQTHGKADTWTVENYASEADTICNRWPWQREVSHPASSAPLEGTGNGADERAVFDRDVFEPSKAMIVRLGECHRYSNENAKREVCREAGLLIAKLADALYRAPRTEVAGAVAEGWKLMPPKLTAAMRMALAKAAADNLKRTGGNNPDVMYEAAFAAAPQPPSADAAAARPSDDELWDQTLRERDEYHETADKLAAAIAKHFGADIGEHSNLNCPWDEALEAIENAVPPAQVATREGLTDLLRQAREELSNVEWENDPPTRITDLFSKIDALLEGAKRV
ncbi:hypothetical protein [Burkholderia vietnamiensis]|uniref:hypothetical protein n=1 Tax=Burkholderia vietnamiensis TaxID=60552 RepID=UPI001CF28B7B|nr:hypothetical protein [Burkholderia vietnamiensis]MCA8226167.1 hypothetical protein [Burkholderia vietnamiensis]